ELLFLGSHVGQLRFGDLGGKTGESGEAQHQMGVELRLALKRNDDRRNIKRTVVAKLDIIQSAVSGDDLILRPHVLLKKLLLNVDRRLSELVSIRHVATERVQCVDQT